MCVQRTNLILPTRNAEVQGAGDLPDRSCVERQCQKQGSSANDVQSEEENPATTLLKEGTMPVTKSSAQSRTFKQALSQEMLHTGLTKVLAGFAWQSPVSKKG